MQKGRNDESGKKAKCVVWDLDHTLWDGVLLEDKHVSLRAQVKEIIETLDERGILQSIASKNDHDKAMERLGALGIEQYFLYPQINWNAKSSSIITIGKQLNIGLDTIFFVDDNPFDRDEVQFNCPQVTCYDGSSVEDLLQCSALRVNPITSEARRRRELYQSDIQRRQYEDRYVGTSEEFLATLKMDFTIFLPASEDLARAEELTVRTNQLNTTGYTYSIEELESLRHSDNHLLLMACLNDIYGTYGNIGLALVEKNSEDWTIKLLLMSCRVMSRGVGTIMLNYIMQLAREHTRRLRAEFIPNGLNRMMYVTYRFAGFELVRKMGDVQVLENDLSTIESFPTHVAVHIDVPDMQQKGERVK